MALRNRNVGPRTSVPGMRDVALGPAIYDGERYSKMSERLKRQHKKPGDVGVGTLKVMAPRLIGLAVALVLVLSYVFWLSYQAAQRRRQKSG